MARLGQSGCGRLALVATCLAIAVTLGATVWPQTPPLSIILTGQSMGGPLFKKYGAYREHVTATWSGDGWVLAHQRAGGTEKTTGAIRRVVPGYEGLPSCLHGHSARSRASSRRSGGTPSR